MNLDFNLLLVGFMGTGKTAVSHYLSSWKNLQEIDMDEQIAAEAGMSIPELFERFGETYFRDLESELLEKLSHEKGKLISCGGGAVLRPENVACMKRQGRIVLLLASPETVLERVRYGKDRPILNGHMNVEYIAELMEKRRASYEAAADIVIATDDKSVEEICQELAGLTGI